MNKTQILTFLKSHLKAGYDYSMNGGMGFNLDKGEVVEIWITED